MGKIEVYATIYYTVEKGKDGTRNIKLTNTSIVRALKLRGANLTLLNDIGDENPEDVMTRLLESIPKE